jgi:hypothetical protein
MGMDDVRGLFAYWHDNPPTHEILKAVYQIERKATTDDERPGDETDPSGIGGMIAAFPNGFVKMS